VINRFKHIDEDDLPLPPPVPRWVIAGVILLMVGVGALVAWM
jgi:hypothetical protein